MKNLLTKLIEKVTGPEGAAHACKKPAYFYSIYEEDGGWFFNWFDESHSKGVVNGPLVSKEMAEVMQQRWADAHRAEAIILQA